VSEVLQESDLALDILKITGRVRKEPESRKEEISSKKSLLLFFI
jgi:hypothetical protein